MTDAETVAETLPDSLIVRPARETDLPAVVALLADDALGDATVCEASDSAALRLRVERGA